jgi:hypothetical protein
MEEDAIINNDFLIDPRAGAGISGIATSAEPLLAQGSRLADIQEVEPGAFVDRSSVTSLNDLFNYYYGGMSSQQPVEETPAVEAGAVVTPAVDTGSQDQATGDLMQDLVPTEDEQTPTESNVYQGSPFIETSPNVLSAVNAAGEPIPGNIVDPTTGNIFAPGDYSDVAGTTSDPREVIDVAAPASQFVDQGFMEDDYGIYDPNVPTSSILDQTFTAPAIGTVDPDQFAGGIAQETFLPDDFAQPTLDAAGTGDASIAEQIAAADRAAGITPQAPVEPPIDTATIDAQTADELAQQPILTPDEPGILDTAVSGVSTAAQNAFETVKDGTSTAVQFISDYGYPAYQALQGNLVAAGASLLNPFTLGLGFAGKVFEGLGDTASKQEYDSYNPEQQSQIDQAYGPGGVMDGYNPVSGFGQGVQATVQSRLDQRRASGIPDASPTSQQLIGLQDNLDITDFTQLTQDDISDRDDIDPADEGREIDFQTGEITGSPTGDVNIFDEFAPATALETATGIIQDPMTGDAQIAEEIALSNRGETSSDSGFSSSDQGETSSDSGFSSSDEGETSSDAGFSDSSDFGGYDSGGYDPAPSPVDDPTDRGGGGGSSGGGGGKIVCTMMNETYGFGSFRNKIWLRQSKDLAPEYQKGYHKLFLPLVRLSRTNIVIRKILEHIAVHRTIDIRQEARGKTHILGRVYRKVLEPICYLVGKYAKR